MTARSRDEPSNPLKRLALDPGLAPAYRAKGRPTVRIDLRDPAPLDLFPTFPLHNARVGQSRVPRPLARLDRDGARAAGALGSEVSRRTRTPFRPIDPAGHGSNHAVEE